MKIALLSDDKKSAFTNLWREIAAELRKIGEAIEFRRYDCKLAEYINLLLLRKSEIYALIFDSESVFTSLDWQKIKAFKKNNPDAKLFVGVDDLNRSKIINFKTLNIQPVKKTVPLKAIKEEILRIFCGDTLEYQRQIQSNADIADTEAIKIKLAIIFFTNR